MVVWHLKQMGKVKKLDKWVPHELTANQIVLKCCLILTITTNQWNCDVWWKIEFTWQLKMISSVVGVRRSSKSLPKAKLTPKIGHGHCLVVCCLSDPLQLSESQWNHYIWKVCSANHWEALKTAMPAAGVGQQNGLGFSPWQCLTAHHTTSASKVGHIGLRSFASSAIFTWPLASQLSLPQPSRQLFAGRMLPQPAGCRICFPRVHWILKIFTLQE